MTVAYGGPVLVVQIVELRKRSGPMVSTPVQYAATLALAGDEHIEAQ